MTIDTDHRSDSDLPNSGPAAPRNPDVVMRLARLGSFHQTRLSFMRALLRRLRDERWTFDRSVWRIDDKGVGVAVYAARGPERTYSLVAFSHDLDPAKRSDRVIAEEWDATFTLFDGVPSEADLERLSHQVPKQEAGRLSERELTLSRANRSVRLFEHVLARLASGRQPDDALVENVGYLMRTTAVYGSGKFGAADREVIAHRPELAAPFRAELLSVYLSRAFTLDLVEHLARVRAPRTAVAISPDLRRRLGIGNSTGLGMAPFLINHPVLLNNWIMAREEALARVRTVHQAEPCKIASFRRVLARARRGVEQWTTAHVPQALRINRLRDDLARLQQQVDAGGLPADHPWDALHRWAEAALSLEGQEYLVSLMIEPYGELVDELADRMSADEQSEFRIDGSMRVGDLLSIVRGTYDWALETDFAARENRARYWYVSEEKLEPRLGERFDEPGANDYEQPLATGRDAASMARALADAPAEEAVAAFLSRHPEHRHAVRRAQIAGRHPYSEIRDNLISADLMPIDLLRCKLSFFGATRFDPRSDRWVRITMYQDAPFPHELSRMGADDWVFPPLEDAP